MPLKYTDVLKSSGVISQGPLYWDILISTNYIQDKIKEFNFCPEGFCNLVNDIFCQSINTFSISTAFCVYPRNYKMIKNISVHVFWNCLCWTGPSSIRKVFDFDQMDYKFICKVKLVALLKCFKSHRSCSSWNKWESNWALWWVVLDLAQT